MPEEWLSMEEARKIVAAQGFKRQKDFYAWNDRPTNIPSNPRSTYGEDWKGWAYFLGKGPSKESSKPKKRKPFLLFEAAKQLAQQLMRKYGITSQPQWQVWVKTADMPPEIPTDPSTTFKKKGWVSWPDWFGREASRATGREDVRPFLEAREFARSLGLKSGDEWYLWAKTNRPEDIPYSPDARYQGEGWNGWPDFLGYSSRWTHFEIAKFLDSLEPCIEQLTELDLYLILSKNGMLRRDARLRAGNLLRGLKNARTKEDLQQAKQQFTVELNNEQTSPSSSDAELDAADRPVAIENLAATDGSTLRKLGILEALQAVDRVTEFNISNDAEVLDFMVSERVSLLWQEAMTSGETAVFDQLNSFQGGSYATLVKDRFTDIFRSVISLGVPEGYRLVDAEGQPATLNRFIRLMRVETCVRQGS